MVCFVMPAFLVVSERLVHTYNHAFLRKAQNGMNRASSLRSCAFWYTVALVNRHTTEHAELSGENAVRLARKLICADGSFKHK